MTYNYYFQWPDGERDSGQAYSRSELVNSIKDFAVYGIVLEDVLDSNYETFSKSFYERLAREVEQKIMAHEMRLGRA